MALTDIRQTVIQIINHVQVKLGVDTTTSAGATKHATLLLRLVNETNDEISDAGDWQEAYDEVNVTAASSTAEYIITPSSGALVKNVYEIAYDTDVAPLYPVDVQDIRRLNRLNSYGRPRQFAMKGVDATTGNPKFTCHPVPASAEAGDLFSIAYFRKPVLYTTADISAIPFYPANILIQGTYAKALLEENGGEPTGQYQVAYQEYLRMRKEGLNRFNADTGSDIYIVPTARR